jgi:subtilisin family serine protease
MRDTGIGLGASGSRQACSRKLLSDAPSRPFAGLGGSPLICCASLAEQSRHTVMGPLDLVGLTALMARSSGRADVKIGLIDGPVALRHPDLSSELIREIATPGGAACAQAGSAACLHGTFVAGILCASRGALAPAICPGCTLLIRPVFDEQSSGRDGMPRTTPEALATAIVDCIEAGACVINLSLALARASSVGEQRLEDALRLAMRCGVIVVAAAGNEATRGSSAITRHAWVIPVVACDLQGRPMDESNLGLSVGRRGLTAPGDGVTSLGAAGPALTFRGTSAAVPFVTGAIALLWSEFAFASAVQIKLAIAPSSPRRPSVLPPLLNAAQARRILSTAHMREVIA